MGSIRPKYIKNAAKWLLEYYPDEFTTDFETNKRLVEQYSDVKSKTVRNRIAGYLVRLVKIQIAREEAEQIAAAEEVEATEIDMEM